MTQSMNEYRAAARAALCAVALPVAAFAAQVPDAEEATHADAAATPQVSYERTAGDVTLRQYQLGCLSQLSYLIASRGDALVVDPARDVDHYVRDAKALGARIRYVVLTHTNADFVAGHTELATRAGAEILISADSASQFPHRALRDGDSVPLGGATFEFLATPGHTLDSLSVLVHVPAAAVEADPLWVLTGDALFIGSIGRPDLAQGTVSPMALASKAFDSVQRFRALPAATIVLPGHGAGSLCGAHLSPDTSSTIGREAATNPYFQAKSRAAFVSRDVSGLAPAPPYFAHNVALNRAGPPVVDWTTELPRALSPADVTAALEAGAWAVDLRDAPAYAKEHVAGSINVAVRGRLDTWTGSVIPFDAAIVLVGSQAEVREAVFRFKRIGLDRVAGYLAVDFARARAGGLALRTTELVSPAALAERIARGTEPILVDVRTAEEYAEFAIGHYANIELPQWQRFGTLLDRELPVLFVCNSAYRSSMAVGLAEKLGFTQVASLDGGLDAWLDAGLPVYGSAPLAAGPVCPPLGAPAENAAVARTAVGATPASAAFELPEPLEPRQLAQLLLDQPQSYALVDVRAAWPFREYHVPGAVNVAPEAVLAHVRSLPRSARVVLLDRDGTIAYAVAGALAVALAPESRTIRVVAGGTARFWREVEVMGQVPLGMRAAPLSPAPAPAPAGTTAPVPGPTKKRSAGC